MVFLFDVAGFQESVKLVAENLSTSKRLDSVRALTNEKPRKQL
jgi:hypothetical protein